MVGQDEWEYLKAKNDALQTQVLELETRLNELAAKQSASDGWVEYLKGRNQYILEEIWELDGRLSGVDKRQSREIIGISTMFAGLVRALARAGVLETAPSVFAYMEAQMWDVARQHGFESLEDVMGAAWLWIRTQHKGTTGA